MGSELAIDLFVQQVYMKKICSCCWSRRNPSITRASYDVHFQNLSIHWSFMPVLTGAVKLPPKGNNKQLRYPNLRLPGKKLWIKRSVSLNDWTESIKWSCTWVQTTNWDYIKNKLVSPFQRHRATSRKVAGSIPDSIIAIVHWLNHLTPNGHFSGRTAPLTNRCSIFYLFDRYTYWIF
jgi:hypothetical protein